MRAKTPPGQGLWSAIWLMPEHDNYGPYPLSGEIDLAEAVNLVPRGGPVHGALHHGPSLAQNRMRRGVGEIADAQAFHLFALEWTTKAMTWFVDGRPFMSQPTAPPFDQRFHLILNLAVGGAWPEANGRGVDGRALPATLEVDWVRVYECLDGVEPLPGPASSLPGEICAGP